MKFKVLAGSDPARSFLLLRPEVKINFQFRFYFVAIVDRSILNIQMTGNLLTCPETKAIHFGKGYIPASQSIAGIELIR